MPAVLAAGVRAVGARGGSRRALLTGALVASLVAAGLLTWRVWPHQPHGPAAGTDAGMAVQLGARHRTPSRLAADERPPTKAHAHQSVSRQRAREQTAPYHVVAGPVIAHKTAAQLLAEKAALIASRSFTFTIGTFNVLGSIHTRKGGDHPRYPPASVRSVGAARLIRAHGVDVLGTQELKPDQLNALQRMTGLAAWPGYRFGTRNTDNNILYDASKFEFVSGTSFPMRFMNAVRPQTVLTLRDRATGRTAIFVNMHASAPTAPRYIPSRNAGHLIAAAQIDKLKAANPGVPIFLTGDMNDRAGFFCRFVPRTGMVAAVGGNDVGGCHPAPHLAVDWILGVQGVSFSHYWEDRSPIGRISDHFFVSAVAHVAGQ